MRRIQDQYNLDGCLSTLPEIDLAKKLSKLSSKKEYKSEYEKNKHDSAFSKGYTDVLEYKVARDANLMMSNKKYKEDWESDKNTIFYPVTLTPIYETATQAQKAVSENLYRRDSKNEGSKSHYDPVKTSAYQTAKNQHDYVSDIMYRAEYQKNKGKGYTPLAMTADMAIANSLRNIMSYKAYTAYARKLWEHYHLVVPIPQIAVAVETAKMTSDKFYMAHFKKEVYGKSGPADIRNYPELLMARRVAGLVSQNAYKKDHHVAKLPYTMSVDAPEFIRAKKAAEGSDILYKKQKGQAIEQFRGFQTMDPQAHPVVKHKQRVDEMNDQKYKEDWEYDKSCIYYPVHITPGYEAFHKADEARSDVAYKGDFEKNKAKNRYDVTSTPIYKTLQEISDATSDVKYKEEYEKNKANLTQIEETPEMKLYKDLQPYQSKTKYSAESKNMLKNVNIGPEMQEVAHAVSSQKMASDDTYRQDYNDNVMGKPPNDPSMAYPQYKHMKEVTEKTNPVNYKREAENIKQHTQIPPDHPDFIRAKQTAKNRSDIEYQKQKKEMIESHRGYQTMDAQDHPVVQQSNKTAELMSEKAYKEEWEYDKSCVYYPVHITPGYEAQAVVGKVQSDTKYKQDFEKEKEKNVFDVTKTKGYQESAEVVNVTSQTKYQEAYQKNKHMLTQMEETPEMKISKDLHHIQSKKLYAAQSKQMQQKVNVGSDLQEISNAVSKQKLTSNDTYRTDYKKNVIGKAPHDVANAYPEYDHLKNVSKQISQREYVQDAEKIKHHHNLPVDYPEFVRAKENAINASDIQYQKQKKETTAAYRGFQTMDSSEHPIVQQGLKAAALMSDKAYREDWEYDKSIVYYPVHITPGYESQAEVAKIQSDKKYKDNFEKEKDKNKFNITDTEHYKTMKEVDEASSDVNYKKGYEANKNKVTSLEETPEMKLAKDLHPVQSKKLYSDESKKMHKNVNVGSDVQEIAHAMSTQKMTSKDAYKSDFMKEMVGKPPHNVAEAYPEYKHLQKVAKEASKMEYIKEAEKIKHHHNLPLDYPEFVRAKENAKNASDMEYKKDLRKITDAYRGFQTMDSADHPIVQRGIKAAELMDDKAYKEDWEHEKSYVYYPVHITPGYEAQAEVSKVQNDAVYKRDFEREKDKNKYNITNTESYHQMKETDQATSERNYRAEYELNKSKFTPLEETPEMQAAKQLHPFQSKSVYTKDSKDMMKNVNVGSDVQEIAHALSTQKLASADKYKEDYQKEMVGKAPHDVAQAYPEYEISKMATKLASKTEYAKDAEKMMHHHNLPLDYPEFVRAKENAKNASQLQYQRQKGEVIQAYRGFQTMDSTDHPIVQQGMKAAELMDSKAYHEDWEYDKSCIYYPVHITPEYEAQVEVGKVQSDVKYKEGFEKSKEKNTFTVTDTEAYKNMKQNDLSSSEVKYRELYLKNKGKMIGVEETPEMKLSKELQPVLSKTTYTEQSKQMHKNVNIGSDLQEIAHAVSTQKLTSEDVYKEQFKKDVVGKGPNDPAQAYPEYKHHREVSKASSKAEYVKEAEKIKHTHNLPLDYPEFVRAKENALNASDINYQKQKKEVIDSYRGFQTMDSTEHPIVQQGIKAAELMSDKAYREDWEYDKSCIYFPVHITPGYEQALEVSKVQSANAYTKDNEKDKSKNKFNITDTDMYKTVKDVFNMSDAKYKEAYEANRGKGFTQMAETPEMAISKALQPLLSHKKYSDESKSVMQKYNLDSSVQEIAHALYSQKFASKAKYLDFYKKNVLGTTTKDPKAFPEYDHAKEVSRLTSKSEYVKDAEKIMHTHNIPLDYPEFVRAKENAKNASDLEYKKQRKEVIDSYKGFQTMDSSDHPIVQQGIKAAELMSDKAYREDWEYDKSCIYYPVHITPGYEQALEVSKVQSDIAYKKQHTADKSKNKYEVTNTEIYKTVKDAAKQSETEYRKEHLLNKGKGHTQMAETPEMTIAKAVQPLLSAKWYADAAKQTMQMYNLDSSVQSIAHALQSQKDTSSSRYIEDFKKNIVGKAPTDLAKSYPEYEHLRNVTKLTSKKEYLKDAEKMMHQHHLPLDYPVFVNAKEVAKNASDIHYKKQRKEVIDSYRGFQTMDSTEHPVVVHGIKAADLISERKYKEDYLADCDLIYYPVHLTPGYEAAINANKFSSEVEYRRKSAKDSDKNKYLYTETERYKTDKILDDLKDFNYKVPNVKFTAMERTPEMELSSLVKDYLSDSTYQKQARKMFDKYNLNIDEQRLAHALSTNEMASQIKYQKDFKDNMIGKAAADVKIAHPEYEHLRAVSKLTSKSEYIKDAEKILHHHNLPLDYPEFVRAKETAKNASDIHYQKQRKEVIDSYRGFQTMDSRDHPVVQQGIKAADLMSDAKYKEDYLADRDLIYYPVHLTPGYESAVNASKYQSETLYREQHQKSKSDVHFNPVETDLYKVAKETQEAVNDIKYRDAALERLSKELTSLAETPEMVVSRTLKPLTSHKLYTDRAKELMNKYHLDVEVPEIAQALFATQIQSKKRYREQYDKEQKGSAPHNIALSYPECDHARKVGKLTSKKEYMKEGEEIKHQFTLPADAPELVRAKEAADNASDIKYKKQMPEIQKAYRGFQTMDTKDHPAIQQSNRAAEQSDIKYKEDYLIERSYIYFPVHLTPGYEVVQASAATADVNYTQKHKNEKSLNRFNVTETDQYKNVQDQRKYMDDNMYKKDLENLTKDFTPIADSLQQVHLNSMQGLLSQKQYADAAKRSLDKYNLNIDEIQIAHAVASAPLASNAAYLSEYKTELVGKPRSQAGMDTYPEYVNAEKVSKLTSKKVYTKDGDELRHQFTMPVDTPELNRAKEAAKNASDLIYKKQRGEVISAFRGFQTMDSKDHPVVQQGIKAADLISDAKYKEDYMIDRNLIYYPVHITPGYESALKASQFNSDVNYHKSAKQNLGDVHYNLTTTDAYKDMKELGKLSDVTYKQDLSTLTFTPIVDAPTMQQAKSAQALTSYWFYKDQAKKMMDKYNLTVDDQQSTHALYASKLYSDVLYKDKYEKEIKGKTTAVTMESYPEHQHAIKANKYLSQTEYTKEAEDTKHHYTLPVDMPSIKHAREVAEMQSNINYVKSRKEVIDSFRGFQTMDSKSHPVVQHGIKAADLISERKYKEDYMEDRNLIYYPVHLTPGYESYTNASKFASDVDYKKKHRKQLASYHNFPAEKTPGYISAREHDQLTNDATYRQKNVDFTVVPDLNETRLFKEVQPLVSQKLYKNKAKELMGKYHLTADIPEIAHALYMTDVASPLVYRSIYEKDLKGKSAQGLEKSEYFAQIKKASELASNKNYPKDRDALRNQYTLDASVPSFEQAKIAGKQASDIEYKKGLLEAREKGTCYHKMAMKEIPAYQKAIDCAINFSDHKYREDYEDMKKYIYFPYHITPQYEKYSEASKLLSSNEYAKDLKKNLQLLRYNYNEVPGYLHQKALMDLISSQKDKQALKELHATGFTSIADDAFQEHVSGVQKRISNNLYKLDAKKVMDQYHITADLPDIKLATYASKLASQNIYKADYESAKGTAGKLDLEMPTFKLAKRVKDLVSDNVYKQGAEEEKHRYSLVPDRPDFVHSMEVGRNVSDNLYKKKGKEESSKCQAYQHLPAKDHRDVAHAIKIRDIISDSKYKEEYNELRNIIYFPVHLTTGYEAAVNANKFASDATYKAKWRANRYKNEFKVNETEVYKHDRSMQEKISDIAYRAKYKSELGKSPYITDTPDWCHQRDMKTLYSDISYRSGAKEIMDKYNLLSDEPRIKQALFATALASEKRYRHEYDMEKGKGASNLHETPQMKQQLQATTLLSEKPYKKDAQQMLSKVRLPEDTTAIKHAASVGKLVSENVYKKEGTQNELQGYKKLRVKDNYAQKFFEDNKDIYSEVQYKKEFNEQKGHNIPVVETPESIRVKNQQKFLSDAVYKKDLEKEIRGQGLTTDSTPQIAHAKLAGELQSQLHYKTGLEDIYRWQSGEAINTPTALKNKENKDIISENKYKEAYESEKGKGCDVVTPAIAHAQEITTLTSDNKYKEKYEEAKGDKTCFSTMESTPQTDHARDIGAKVSSNKYKEQHEKEDIGKSAELKDSVLLQSNLKTTELQSNLKYGKQADEAIEQYKGYFHHINETPSMKHTQKVRDLLSRFKYRAEYENDKTIIYFPYFLTPQYESQKKASELLSDNIYKSKAEKERGNIHIPVDTPSLVHAKEADALLSDLIYKKDYEQQRGKGITLRSLDDLPLLLHSKKMQRLVSENKYKAKSNEIKDKYHLDVTTPQMMNAKKANKLASINAYKDQYEKEKGQPYNVTDSFEMNHLKHLPDQFSDTKYKQDLIVSRGKVIQTEDTPWLTSFQQAQDYVSNIKYGKKPFDLKSRYQPDKFNAHIKKVTENISDQKYHEDFEEYFRGNLIPVPDHPELQQVLRNSKLISNKNYKDKARKDLQHYILVPDTPEFQRLKEAANYLSDITYKEEGDKIRNQYTIVADTPAIINAKESQALTSEQAYRKDAKQKMATEYMIPAEGTPTIQQQRYATTLASDKDYKEKGEEIKHQPWAYSKLQETRDTKHAKDMGRLASDISYKSSAKKELQHIHPSAETPWLTKAKEVMDNVSETKYKAKDKDLHQKYRMREGDDRFIKHALEVRDKISDVKYKEQYMKDIGICWCLPSEMSIDHAIKANELASDNQYKKQAQKLKGKYHITTDTPEYERLRKLKDEMSETQYRDELKKFTALAATPEMQHATKVSSLVSKNKYKEDHEKSKGHYTVLKNDPKIAHDQQVNKQLSDVAYKKDIKKMKEDGYTFLADAPDMEHNKKLQKNISNTEYKREAKEHSDFTVLEETPEVKHALDTAKMQSNLHYKQKVQGKDIALLQTPHMKHVMNANKLQSDLKYKEVYNNDLKGKGWRFTQDTPTQRHVESIGKVQSDYKYRKNYKDNVGKGFTVVTDRPDLVHATNIKDVVSDYEYKRRHRDMVGKGYTFVADNPGIVHAEEANILQSELRYRRNYDKSKGKGWQSEDSPAHGHFKEAQKLVDNIDYKKSAQEINARGTGASMEVTPSQLHHKRAAEILDNRKYKSDYEQNIKGRGMNMDMVNTPSMDHIRRAEAIKSDINYKSQYQENMRGRPTAVMDAPHILHAQQASQLISDNKYKADYHNNIRGKAHSMTFTPEMERVCETQKMMSQNAYKSDAEEHRSNYSAPILDTPEWRRIKQNTKNFSTVKYKDNSSIGRSINVLDTPEFRTAKRNKENFSQIKYQEDRSKLRGQATQVTDDPQMRRALQAAKIASDVEYKKTREKSEEMEKRRQQLVAEQQQKNRTKLQTTLRTSQVAPAKHPAFSQRNVVRHGPVKRWRRQPGSIFDYDPSEYETEQEYEDGIAFQRKTEAISRPYHTDTEADFVKNINWKSNTMDNKLTPWTDYIAGKAYKPVHAPGSVLDYDPVSRMQQMHVSDKQKEEPAPVHVSPPSSPIKQQPQVQKQEPVKAPEPEPVKVEPTPKEPEQSADVIEELVRKGDGHVYQAMYDYAAQDDDEVTFMDGDVIINAQKIDDGWMFGTVERTGQTGMLPSNYVSVAQ
uniref:nebulin-like isoform X8 n=1 Tax=Styela clava TaxID=7725 RepID=UPI00193A2D1A|nr:nebulin-like isoform X8 [Styela clava]